MTGESPTRRAIDAVWRIESAKIIAERRTHGARRRPGRGAGAGRARRRARDVARQRRAGQSRRLAHDHREAPRARPAAPAQAASSASTRNYGRELEVEQELRETDPADALDDDIGDDLLRLVFIACHPVLSTEARVALTLRLLGGLTTDEIARAFLVPEADHRAAHRARQAHARRGARAVRGAARRRARAARLSSVLEVLYLVFNEGYSATAGDDWMRPALCDDALRLGRILAELMPRRARGARPRRADGDPGVAPAARASAPDGEPILLLDQDRARWDQLLIRRGLAALARAEALARHARAVRAAGRDRRLPRTCARRGRDRLGSASPRSTTRWRRLRPRPSSS